MKITEQQIDKVINETISSYLQEDMGGRFMSNLKNRVKNGLKGFDIGGNYQRNIDMYHSNDYSQIISKLNEYMELMGRFTKYLQTYKGKNTDIIDLKNNLLKYQNYLTAIYDTYDNNNIQPQQVTESLGNRLGGFARGFIKNKDYKKNVSDNTLDFAKYIDNILQHLKSLTESIIDNIINIEEQYPKQTKFLNNLYIIEDTVQEITKFISKNTYKHREEHSKWTDRGYKMGSKVYHTPKKVIDASRRKLEQMIDDDSYEGYEDYVNQREEPTIFSEMGEKIKKYARQHLGDERYNKLKQYAKEED